MRQTDIAYAAGFFDGEGSVTLSLQQGKYLRIEVAVSQKPIAVLYWHKQIFGGKIYQSKSYAAQWKLHGIKGIEFLELLLPYLIVKSVDVTEARRMWNARRDTEVLKQLMDERKERRARVEQEITDRTG